jgi:hypothetical protein
MIGNGQGFRSKVFRYVIAKFADADFGDDVFHE